MIIPPENSREIRVLFGKQSKGIQNDPTFAGWSIYHEVKNSSII